MERGRTTALRFSALLLPSQCASTAPRLDDECFLNKLLPTLPLPSPAAAAAAAAAEAEDEEEPPKKITVVWKRGSTALHVSKKSTWAAFNTAVSKEAASLAFSVEGRSILADDAVPMGWVLDRFADPLVLFMYDKNLSGVTGNGATRLWVFSSATGLRGTAVNLSGTGDVALAGGPLIRDLYTITRSGPLDTALINLPATPGALPATHLKITPTTIARACAIVYNGMWVADVTDWALRPEAFAKTLDAVSRAPHIEPLNEGRSIIWAHPNCAAVSAYFDGPGEPPLAACGGCASWLCKVCCTVGRPGEGPHTREGLARQVCGMCGAHN